MDRPNKFYDLQKMILRLSEGMNPKKESIVWHVTKATKPLKWYDYVIYRQTIFGDLQIFQTDL